MSGIEYFRKGAENGPPSCSPPPPPPIPHKYYINVLCDRYTARLTRKQHGVLTDMPHSFPQLVVKGKDCVRCEGQPTWDLRVHTISSAGL